MASTLRSYALFTTNEAPATALTLSEIDFTIRRVNKSTQAVDSVVSAADAEFEVGGGYYGYYLEDADTDTYDYIGFATYTGATAVDSVDVFLVMRTSESKTENVLRLYSLFTSNDAAATGLTLSDIDYTIFRVEDDQTVITLVNAQDAAFEVGNGFYAYYVNDVDFATYDYLGYAHYVGTSQVDTHYAYSLVETSETSSSNITASHQALPYATAVWVWDNSGSAYINNTNAARSKSSAAFTIMEATADYTYIGAESRFDAEAWVLATAGAGLSITREYWNGTAWTEFISENEYTFTTGGGDLYGRLPDWTARTFSTTSPHTGSPPDTRSRYFIRLSVSAVTTAPTVTTLEIRPWASYCTPTDVKGLLQLSEDFSSTTTPTREEVENTIHSAESYIDHETKKSWRLNVVTDEDYEFSMAGIRLYKQNIRDINSLQIWDGGQYQSYTEGRTNDFFMVKDIGMVFFSRFFLLPARMQSVAAPMWMWSWGEFSFPVRISYTYGKKIDTDAEHGGTITDIARKLAAIDLWQNTDFGVLTISGADKMSIESKISEWKKEIEDELDKLRGWVTM